VGNWRNPKSELDFGNSGTGSRLVMGAMATTPITAVFTGDASLRSRPMARVVDPLKAFGVTYEGQGSKALMPLTLHGARDAGAVTETIKVASAQVSLRCCWRRLNAHGTSRITQTTLNPRSYRKDAAAFGAKITARPLPEGGEVISVDGPAKLTGCSVEVPRDPSSAAFPLVSALIVPGSEIELPAILLNPAAPD